MKRYFGEIGAGVFFLGLHVAQPTVVSWREVGGIALLLVSVVLVKMGAALDGE